MRKLVADVAVECVAGQRADVRNDNVILAGVTRTFAWRQDDLGVR